MGLCALVLVVLPAAAAQTSTASSAKLATRIATHKQSIKKARQVIAFFRSHRWLLDDPRYSADARAQLAFHLRHLAEARRAVVRTQAAKRRLDRQLLAAKAARSPRNVICDVFGEYCREAVAVAHCE